MTANYNAGHTSSYGEEFCYCIDSIPWSGKFGDFGN